MEDKEKIAWVRWEEVCKAKYMGGLGIKNIVKFNYALLGKWRWRLIPNQECLWYKVLKSRYGA